MAKKIEKTSQNDDGFIVEEIFSSTPEKRAKAEAEAVTESQKSETVLDIGKYSDYAITNIDKTIKTISFIVALAIALVFLAIAAVIVLLDKSFLVIALGIAVIGLVIAIITLFLIYAVGHIITQNNEILKRL